MSEQELSAEEIAAALNDRGWHGASDWEVSEGQEFVVSRSWAENPDYESTPLPNAFMLVDAHAIVQGWADAALMDWLEGQCTTEIADLDSGSRIEAAVKTGSSLRNAIKAEMERAK